MNIISFAVMNLRHKVGRHILMVGAISLGVCLLSVITIFAWGIGEGLEKNQAGIDVVVGAKGSPLQLVLSSVYHTDIPSGNIPDSVLNDVRKNPFVKRAIPVAMGDHYRGARLIGTEAGFIDLYQAQINDGQIFDKNFEVVAGALTGLQVGDEFRVTHGYETHASDHDHHGHDGMHEDEHEQVHDDHSGHDEIYRVVGVLQPTGKVIDRLILSTVESVQDTHREGHEGEHEGEHSSEITSILIEVRNGAALINFPRQINKMEGVQAVHPASEINQFLNKMGVGKNIIKILAYAFILLSFGGLIAALSSGLIDRRKDMAVLRVMGVSQSYFSGLLISEGVIIAVSGVVLGLLMAAASFMIIPHVAGVLGGVFMMPPVMYIVSMGAFGIIVAAVAGAMAALPACLSAMRQDIADLLTT